MAAEKPTSDIDLTFIVDNCITSNPELHPDKWYMEIVDGTEKIRELPSTEDPMNINFNN